MIKGVKIYMRENEGKIDPKVAYKTMDWMKTLEKMEDE